MKVRLTASEADLAFAVGYARRNNAVAHGRQARYGCSHDDLILADIQAAAGELAAAIAYGLPWTGVYFRTLPDTKPADVGRGTEVRTRSEAWHDLIVHPEDADTFTFVLVTGSLPEFEVVGHIAGGRAKRREWWKDPAGGRPAFFVPQTALTRPPVTSDGQAEAEAR